MDSGLVDRISVPEMFQKHQTLSFLGRRSFAPRPLSEATEIFDTDIEDDDSPSSLDSQSTLSSLHEVTTPPLSGGLGGYEFHFDDKPVAGPYGPHLFTAEKQQFEEDVHILPSISPIPQTPKTPARPIATLNTAVAELDESQVRSWNPEQVADWMTGAGFDSSVIDKFLIHDICGNVLLDLQFEDLKELDISSFGKRHQVMSSIQQLRNSTLMASPVSRKTSVAKSSRSQSRRRGRHTPKTAEAITPAESVSIVAIEQVLPKPHVCSKGEDCPKWQKQQRKIQRLEEQLAADVKSIAVPSVVASSDVLGPSQGLTITSERLSAVEQRDPLENVRNFLNFQHVNSPTTVSHTSPPAHYAQNLNGLPKLTIPTTNADSESPFHTPISALRNPTEYQAKLRADLQEDPYHYGGVASPVDVYRLASPMSATDIPVTAMPIDPCQRDASHSVPPEMRYGAPTSTTIDETLSRSASARHPRRPSFAPHMTTVREATVSPTLPPVTSEADLANHSGWMRKRKTTRLMRHEWQDNYYTLSGTKLGMHRDESAADEETLQSINVDEYTLHAYATASSSKLSAAFKKSLGTNAPVEPTFAFSLIPEAPKSKKLFEKEKSHHFAVSSGKDRVEWMRKLMLAKAMKKNDGQI